MTTASAMAKNEETTIVTGTTPIDGKRRPVEPCLGLVVVWDAHDAVRVGEVLLVPRGPAVLFGRGEPRVHDRHPRATFLRQRPGASVPSPPVANPRISREQLLLRALSEGELELEGVGRCALRFRGANATKGSAHPGDLVELVGQMSFLCVQRLPTMPEAPNLPPSRYPAFGEADADGIVGESPAAWELRERLAFIAGRHGHALLTGESGAGKELCARAIHAASVRRQRPFVARNAATIPSSLADAEIFGNVRNYPNPGMPARVGLVGAAEGSTLFLDEVGELPADVQTHLLRLLDDGGEFHRLGEAEARNADLRLLGATNRSVSELRADLAARFKLTARVPSLSERREDVPLIARYLLRRIAEHDRALAERFFDAEGGLPRISQELLGQVVQHPLRGNVRELEAMFLASMAESRGAWLEPLASAETSAPDADEREETLPGAETVRMVLERCGGVQERAWRELGLRNRYVLKRLIAKYKLRALDE